MAIQVLDELGNPVDFSFMYKTPHLPGAASGYGYMYYDSAMDTAGEKIALSSFALDKEEGAFHRTLAQQHIDGAGYIKWNDERPDGHPDDGLKGHSKGFFIADDKTGVYQLHSWPLTPAVGVWKAPTPIYGQTFLALSLDIATLERIATQMLSHQEPQVYDVKSLDTWGPDLRSMAMGQLVPRPAPSFDILDGETLGGMAFKLLAENRQNNGNFWDEIANALGVPINTETWVRGPLSPVQDPGGTFRVFDVKSINLHPLGQPLEWSETFDHSKFGLSDDPTKPWVIIADKNRQDSQRKRGGGGIAIQCPHLWYALSQIDSLTPPPGVTKEAARAHIKTSHGKVTAHIHT